MSHDQETTIADVLRGRMATYQFLSRLFRVRWTRSCTTR